MLHAASLKVVVGQPQEPFFDLNSLQKRLKALNYHGQITLVLKEGEIVLVREERTLQPHQLNQI